MILDMLENVHRYEALQNGFSRAIEFLQRPDFAELTKERYEIVPVALRATGTAS